MGGAVGGHDGGDLVGGGFLLVGLVDDHMRTGAPEGHLLLEGGETAFDINLFFSITTGEASETFVGGRRGDEDHDRVGNQVRNGASALHVDPQEHVLTPRQERLDLSAGSAVAIAVDLGPFKEFSGLSPFKEFVVGDEEVLTFMLLTGAGLPGESGPDLVEGQVAALENADDRVLPAAGRAGDYE